MSDLFGRNPQSTSRGQEILDEFCAALTWSRVSHLNRMLTPAALVGADSDFRDADDAINRAYKDRRRLIERREPLEALKQAQLAWIAYRDAAAGSEVFSLSGSHVVVGPRQDGVDL